MFLRARNYETAFQHIRLVCILSILANLCFTGVITWRAMGAVERAGDRVYVLASGKALQALASDRRENIPVEARDHIRSFHHAFFTLDPDEKVINTNITSALYLADGSAKRLYDDLKETGYYAGIISGNISQEITVDSITLDTRAYPYFFRCYATQKVIRTTSLVTRSLVTQGWLRYTSRSDNNPHGFLIEDWSTLENKDLSTQTR
jgi:conjugative transposon TraK protein